MAAKTEGWTPAAVRVGTPSRLRETPAPWRRSTSSLLEGIDSLLGVLDAQAGTYTLTKNTIKFEDRGRGSRVRGASGDGSWRRWIRRKAAGGWEQPGPMTYLLQAIGATRLPLAT